METLIQDLKYSLRMLRKFPGFTLVAVLCIGLGIGANAAVFSVVRGVLLRPLPFPSPERLVAVYDTYKGKGATAEASQVSRPNFLLWRQRNRSFASLGAAEIAYFNLTGEGEPLRVRGALASADLFPTLGVKPLLGRAFEPAEEGRSGVTAPVVVLSHSFWRDHFGSDPQVLGKTLNLDGKGRTVVGVMPPGFTYPEGIHNPGGASLWVPLDPTDTSPEAQWHTLNVVARLNPGTSIEQAQLAMSGLAGQLEHELPTSNKGWGVQLVDLHKDLVGDVRPALLTLMAVVGFVLLIACVNVANLQIARSLTRHGEVAVRMALGASRRRLVRQLLTENVILAVLGGLAGLLFAYYAIPLLAPLNPSHLSMFEGAKVDPLILLLTVLVSIAAGTLLGLAPALSALQVEVNGTLRDVNGRVVGRGSGRRLQAVLVVGQVALALVLLTGAGVLFKSLLRVQEIDPGFKTGNLLTLGMILPTSKYPELHNRVDFVERMLDRVRALPGVKAAGTSLAIPIAGTLKARMILEDRPASAKDEILATNHRLVSPGFLETIGIPLLKGRLFTAADHATAPGAVIVSKELARRYWPDQDPLGKRVRRSGKDAPWLTVVGVVDDVRDAGLDAPVEPAWYLPYTQHDFTALRLLVRTAGNPLDMVGPVRAAIQSVDRDQAVYDVDSMDGVLATSLAKRRFSAFMVSLFAVIGLVLMTVGLYGVISHLVSQRVREIGIRIALGAQTREVLLLVLREGLALTSLGLLLGLVGTFALTRYLASSVFGLAPNDPVTLVETSVVLAAAALAAVLFPARRASRVDPLMALRD